jgi:hypothetical protein
MLVLVVVLLTLRLKQVKIESLKLFYLHANILSKHQLLNKAAYNKEKGV